METVLYLTHTESDGSLGKPALEALSAALQLAQELDGSPPLTIGLIGGEVQAAADTLAGCGAGRFLGVAGAELAFSRYSSDAAAVAALVEAAQPTLVVAAATSRFSRALPGVCQRVEGRIDTQVTGLQVVDTEPRIERWYYRQRMAATLTRSHRPWFLLLAGGAFPAWEGEAGTAEVEAVPVELPETRTRVVGTQSASADAHTIRPEADLLFVAGAGWTKKQVDGQPHVTEAEQCIREFVDAAQASLGSSKSLVDQGGEGQQVLSFMSHLHQVGQTGTTPRHRKGLATCCHGEEPHVVGWRFISERRAINLDAGCGWAQGKADVLYVADAFDVMTKVNELLGES
ncbi:MAG: FAD-binding protein [Gammaproteobacteria bacterium]|nr:FAD-binding protein [Gammaproteobacteria bacterium]